MQLSCDEEYMLSQPNHGSVFTSVRSTGLTNRDLNLDLLCISYERSSMTYWMLRVLAEAEGHVLLFSLPSHTEHSISFY
jgi:hypothetical protein